MRTVCRYGQQIWLMLLGVWFPVDPETDPALGRPRGKEHTMWLAIPIILLTEWIGSSLTEDRGAHVIPITHSLVAMRPKAWAISNLQFAKSPTFRPLRVTVLCRLDRRTSSFLIFYINFLIFLGSGFCLLFLSFVHPQWLTSWPRSHFPKFAAYMTLYIVYGNRLSSVRGSSGNWWSSLYPLWEKIYNMCFLFCMLLFFVQLLWIQSGWWFWNSSKPHAKFLAFNSSVWVSFLSISGFRWCFLCRIRVVFLALEKSCLCLFFCLFSPCDWFFSFSSNRGHSCCVVWPKDGFSLCFELLFDSVSLVVPVTAFAFLLLLS